jgi:hypothetical protein
LSDRLARTRPDVYFSSTRARFHRQHASVAPTSEAAIAPTREARIAPTTSEGIAPSQWKPRRSAIA